MSNARDLSQLVRFFTVNTTSLALNANSFTSVGNINAVSVTVTGSINANTVTATGNVIAGAVSATGNVTAGAVLATGNVTAGAVTATGNIVGGTLATAVKFADRSIVVRFQKPGIPISSFNATTGQRFTANSTCTKISYQWLNAQGVSSNSAAPTLTAGTARLRLLSASGVVTSTSYTLPARAANGIIKGTDTLINAGDQFFWDVVSGGKLPGTGLIIIMDYYIGRPSIQLG